MIIDCTYSTYADMGVFESNAKLDTETGIVFDIEDCTDSDAENIESVHREAISFKFNDFGYDYTVSYEDELGEYRIEDMEEIKLFNSINLSQKLEKSIPEKEQKSKNKI